MKNLKALTEKSNLLKGLAAAVIIMTVFWMTAFNSFAAEGKVIADTAKIRAEANTSSEVIASTVKGKTIDIVGVEQDSSGMKWYKVPVAGGGYGYIRSDLVETAETLEFYEDDTTQAVATTTETQKPAETVPTSIGEQQAVIKCDTNVKIRSGASTSHDVVTSLPNGTAITLIGEANDSAGNKWYQMTCSYNGRTIEGYVRSDLIAIGAATVDNPEGGEGENTEGGEDTPEDGNLEGTEGEAPEGGEEPVSEPEEEHNDYEIRWAKNQDNDDYDYFLYDNISQNRMRLSEVMNAVNASNENAQKLQDQVDKDKIIIIILAVVIVLFFIAVTILLLKIRSLYYEDYDEDDEEEEEEEEIPVRKKAKRREEEEEEAAPVRRKKTSSQREEAPASRESERPAKKRKTSTEEPELRAAERKESPKKPASRKPQNFLVDDDEFEFEFLNMDDKDL